VPPDSSLQDHARNIPRVLDLPVVRALVVRADVRALARVQDSAVRAPEASVLPVVRFLRRAKLHALRVLRDRRAAVAVSSIRRRRKAR
jgi:hypothetical protein